VRNPEQNLTGNTMMSPRVVARQRLFIGSHRDLFRVSAALVLWLSVLLSIVSQPWVIETFVNRIALGLSYFLFSLLQLLGNEIERVGVIIRSDALSMEINHKCTAVYQVAVYCAGVLAYRTRLRNKAVGLFWGICVISIANILRIVAIFYVGVYTPGWIPFVHNVLGEAFMIVLILITWFLWARRIAGAVPGG